MSKAKGVSIVLCCYNSEKRLPDTLKHLADQKVSTDIAWEIILIDNNSQDNTASVAQCIWNNLDCPTPFKIIQQLTPGLSAAREKGFESVSFEYVLFCDDDNWLDEYYVQNTFRIMEADPLIGVLGGKGEPVFEGEAPEWFSFVKGQYATGEQAPTSGDVSNSRSYVYGAGSVIRFSAYQLIREKGFKSLLTGRKGKELSSGEDNELCYVIILAGYKVWYDKTLVFKHYLPNGRLTLDYLLKLNKAFALTAFYLRAYTYYFSNNKIKSYVWLRDLRHLILFTPKLVREYIQQPLDSNERAYRKIMLQSHIQLIKFYMKKRSLLDKTIDEIGTLVARLKP